MSPFESSELLTANTISQIFGEIDRIIDLHETTARIMQVAESKESGTYLTSNLALGFKIMVQHVDLDTLARMLPELLW